MKTNKYPVPKVFLSTTEDDNDKKNACKRTPRHKNKDAKNTATYPDTTQKYAARIRCSKNKNTLRHTVCEVRLVKGGRGSRSTSISTLTQDLSTIFTNNTMKYRSLGISTPTRDRVAHSPVLDTSASPPSSEPTNQQAATVNPNSEMVSGRELSRQNKDLSQRRIRNRRDGAFSVHGIFQNRGAGPTTVDGATAWIFNLSIDYISTIVFTHQLGEIRLDCQDVRKEIHRIFSLDLIQHVQFSSPRAANHRFHETRLADQRGTSATNSCVPALVLGAILSVFGNVLRYVWFEWREGSICVFPVLPNEQA